MLYLIVALFMMAFVAGTALVIMRPSNEIGVYDINGLRSVVKRGEVQERPEASYYAGHCDYYTR